MMATPRHGGSLDRAIAEFGGEREQWLDLSTGINPHAWPVPPVPAELWHRLPEPSLDEYCRDAAQAYYGAPEHAGIVAAPGAQALIQRLPALVEPERRVAVVGPTYNEYERCFAAHERTVGPVREVPRPEDGFGCVVIGNPNNPDGARVGGRHDRQAIERLLAHGCMVIVDEAFGDVAPDASFVPNCGLDGLIVLRSFGKFFGLAGIRLGFAIGSQRQCARLGAMLGPWAVPGPTLFIGGRAMRDIAWIAETRTRLMRDRQRLVTLLERAGFAIVGQTDLFVLVSHGRAPAIHADLARQHILVRAFDYDAGWLRFGLPGDDAGFARLEGALAQAV